MTSKHSPATFASSMRTTSASSMQNSIGSSIEEHKNPLITNVMPARESEILPSAASASSTVNAASGTVTYATRNATMTVMSPWATLVPALTLLDAKLLVGHPSPAYLSW